jgi:hypothetical protein
MNPIDIVPAAIAAIHNHLPPARRDAPCPMPAGSIQKRLSKQVRISRTHGAVVIHIRQLKKFAIRKMPNQLNVVMQIRQGHAQLKIGPVHSTRLGEIAGHH